MASSDEGLQYVWLDVGAGAYVAYRPGWAAVAPLAPEPNRESPDLEISITGGGRAGILLEIDDTLYTQVAVLTSPADEETTPWPRSGETDPGAPSCCVSGAGLDDAVGLAFCVEAAGTSAAAFAIVEVP